MTRRKKRRATPSSRRHKMSSIWGPEKEHIYTTQQKRPEICVWMSEFHGSREERGGPERRGPLG